MRHTSDRQIMVDGQLVDVRVGENGVWESIENPMNRYRINPDTGHYHLIQPGQEKVFANFSAATKNIGLNVVKPTKTPSTPSTPKFRGFFVDYGTRADDPNAHLIHERVGLLDGTEMQNQIDRNTGFVHAVNVGTLARQVSLSPKDYGAYTVHTGKRGKAIRRIK